jgi:hypothetical protein
LRKAQGLKIKLFTMRKFFHQLVSVLRTQSSGSTLLRLGTSRHLLDLQLIWTVALIVTVFSIIIAAVYAFDLQLHSTPASPLELQHAPPSEPQHSTFSGVHAVFDWFIKFSGVLAPILTAFGGVSSWIYLQGNSRLGVVDLFSCEIGTVCRICTITDVARQYVASYEESTPVPGDVQPPRQGQFQHFTSEENYFPAFETNIRSLQVLEARVVINITAFYTYMKALRDTRRKIERIAPLPINNEKKEPWHVAMRDSLYMLFLASESGRKAINDLVEFDPEEAELQVTILITELECYNFLLGKFASEDVRQARLLLRALEYPQVFRRLHSRVTSGTGKAWQPAKELMPEMKRRYDRVYQCHREYLDAQRGLAQVPWEVT